MKTLASKSTDSNSPLADDAGSVVARWYAPGIIEVEWSGHVTGETITEALVKAKEVQAGARVDRVIANTTHVHGYTLSVRNPSIRFMEYFREQGVKEFIGVIPNNAVRLFAGSMALITRMKFPLFSSREKAIEYIDHAATIAAVSD